MDGPSNPNYTCESRPLFDRTWLNTGTSPERMLWCMVLIVYLQDLQHAYDVWRSSTNGHTKEFRDKLLKLVDEGMSDEVGCICELVDIDHEVFIDRAQGISEGVDRFQPLNRNFL